MISKQIFGVLGSQPLSSPRGLHLITNTHQWRWKQCLTRDVSLSYCGQNLWCSEFFLTNVFLVSSGLDADTAEWPPSPGDWDHRQGDGKEIWQILQEDDLPMSTEGPWEKVFIVMPLIILVHYASLVLLNIQYVVQHSFSIIGSIELKWTKAIYRHCAGFFFQANILRVVEA